VATVVERRLVVRAEHLVHRLLHDSIDHVRYAKASARAPSRCFCRSGPGAPSFAATFSSAVIRLSSFATSSIVIAGRAVPFVVRDFGAARGADAGRPASAPVGPLQAVGCLAKQSELLCLLAGRRLPSPLGSGWRPCLVGVGFPPPGSRRISLSSYRTSLVTFHSAPTPGEPRRSLTPVLRRTTEPSGM
jgi:hypothetical protein